MALWPLAVSAQQPKTPVVGFLGISNPQTAAGWLAEWHEGLRATGFVEGRNLTVKYRWAEGDRRRVPGLVADLIGRVDVFATPDPGAVIAAKQASTTTPIVFSITQDAVGLGFVASLNKPGVTGIAGEGLAEKKLQMLHELVPAAAWVGYLVDHKASLWPGELERVVDAGKTLGLEVILLAADQPADVETAVATGRRAGIGAVLVQDPSTLFFTERERVVELLARHVLPSTCPPSSSPTQGCLMNYIATDTVYLAGTQVGRILNGAKPAELPGVRLTKFELSINLKTAKALGLTVSPTLLAAAELIVSLFRVFHSTRRVAAVEIEVGNGAGTRRRPCYSLSGRFLRGYPTFAQAS